MAILRFSSVKNKLIVTDKSLQALCIPLMLLLSSCASWKSLDYPQDNLVGKTVINDGSFISEGNSYQLTTVKSFDALSTNENEQLSAKLAAGFESILVNAGVASAEIKSIDAKDVSITRIENFIGSAPIGSRIVYECASAGKYDVTFSRALDANAQIALDQSVPQKISGSPSINVNVDSKSANSRSYSLSKGVCFAYRAAKLSDTWKSGISGFFIPDDAHVNFTSGPSFLRSFNLQDGDASNYRTAAFKGSEPGGEPSYRIVAQNNSNNQLELKVCKKPISSAEVCPVKIGQAQLNGERIHVDIFSYAPAKYKVVEVQVYGKINGGSVSITEAIMRYPQFEVELD
jgi:hypothetical protein